MIILH